MGGVHRFSWFCRSKTGEDNGEMLPLHVQLQNSTLRGVLRRLHFPLEVMKARGSRAGRSPQRVPRFCRNSAMRKGLATRPTVIRKPASRTGSLQTRLGL